MCVCGVCVCVCVCVCLWVCVLPLMSRAGSAVTHSAYGAGSGRWGSLELLLEAGAEETSGGAIG